MLLPPFAGIIAIPLQHLVLQWCIFYAANRIQSAVNTLTHRADHPPATYKLLATEQKLWIRCIDKIQNIVGERKQPRIPAIALSLEIELTDPSPDLSRVSIDDPHLEGHPQFRQTCREPILGAEGMNVSENRWWEPNFVAVDGWVSAVLASKEFDGKLLYDAPYPINNDTPGVPDAPAASTSTQSPPTGPTSSTSTLKVGPPQGVKLGHQSSTSPLLPTALSLPPSAPVILPPPSIDSSQPPPVALSTCSKSTDKGKQRQEPVPEEVEVDAPAGSDEESGSDGSEFVEDDGERPNCGELEDEGRDGVGEVSSGPVKAKTASTRRAPKHKRAQSPLLNPKLSSPAYDHVYAASEAYPDSHTYSHHFVYSPKKNAKKKDGRHPACLVCSKKRIQCHWEGILEGQPSTMKNSVYGRPEPPEASRPHVVPIPLDTAPVTSPTHGPKRRKLQQAVGDGQEKVKLELGKPQSTTSSRGRSTSSNTVTGPSTRQTKRKQKDHRVAPSTALEEGEEKDLAETGATGKPAKVIPNVSTHFITVPFAYPIVPEFQDIDATSLISSSLPPTPAVVQHPLPQDVPQFAGGGQTVQQLVTQVQALNKVIDKQRIEIDRPQADLRRLLSSVDMRFRGIPITTTKQTQTIVDPLKIGLEARLNIVKDFCTPADMAMET
ncbi:hypothetical protein JAAARDRAFT_194127 [Jaapia argillacea MUCL 33604]|uniref:Zn(2)-C6 fungal-type domain-containing protein n=1 Tax=Jaapia argillacea MUCL 33604 TaxID=933084 RepID=A0A067PSX9_9AGAM|nr:hypothetical protein JAAARDRAFT_194127 [Jaapia argillacea MUCL 33604]